MPPAKNKKISLYLILGNSEAEVNDARYELVNSLLTREERDSGLSEIRGPGNQPASLDNTMNEIVEELGTTSFIGGSRRVVVIYDLKEFFQPRRGGKAKKAPAKSAKPPAASRLDTFMGWLSEVLPTTENIAVFVCTENDEKQRVVDQNSDLVAFVRERGQVIERREKPLNFELEDLILTGNGPAAIVKLREWLQRIGSDSGGRLRVYTTMAGLVELALQSRCIQDARLQRVPEAQVAVATFPTLARIPGWKAKKIETFAQRFSYEQLHRLVAHLNKLQRLMYPTGDEDYVADWEDYLELILMELTMVR